MNKPDEAEIIYEKVVADPKILKSLNRSELDLLCLRLRDKIIEACSEYGGHLSPNLGDVELIVALHRFFDFPNDKLIFDVGHQAYAHKLLSGRSLDHLGEEGKTACFQKISESPYDPFDAGHSSTSLSAASAFAFVRDEKNENHDVIAFIGDASIANGLAFEALNYIGDNPNKVIVILNDNDMSISKPSGAIGNLFRGLSTGKNYNRNKEAIDRFFNKTGFGRWMLRGASRVKNALKRHLVPKTLFDNFGLNYIGPINGHDFKEIEKALIRAKRSDKSVVIHARTIKGKGYPYAENDKTGYWHGTSPFHIGTGQPKSTHPGFISWSHFFSDLTFEALANHKDAKLITPATLKGSGLEKVFGTYPHRCFDFGIAEEHAITFSGALAVQGEHPIVSIYSTFLQRAYDEVFHDCARLKANMTILIDRASMCGAYGETHQGVYDVAYLSSIPGVTVAMASDKAIAKALYEQSFDNHGVFAIRYPRELVDERTEPPAVELHYLRFRYEGNSKSHKLAVVAVGPKEKELLGLLKKTYLDCEVIDPVYLCPLQADNLLPLLRYEQILIYDAYSTETGFARNLKAGLADMGYKGKITTRAIPNEFIPQNSYDKQVKQFGLAPAQIVSLIKELLGEDL